MGRIDIVGKAVGRFFFLLSLFFPLRNFLRPGAHRYEGLMGERRRIDIAMPPFPFPSPLFPGVRFFLPSGLMVERAMGRVKLSARL